jgi:hypothetical protein
MNRLCTLLVFLCLPLSAHGALLGTASHVFDASITPPQPHEVRPQLDFGGVPALFDGVVLTQASQGQVLTANAVTDPDFAAIVADLSDGQVDQMNLWAFVGVGGFGLGSSEQLWFSLGSVDFAGYSIDTITLTVDEITFDTADNTTTVHVKFTVRVYGDRALPVAATTWGAVKAMYR